MPNPVNPRALGSRSQARQLALAALTSAILLASCGGTSPNHPPATVGAATNSAASIGSGGGATSSHPATPPDIREAALAFSRCMRANGVPNFPDPQPGGGFLFNS